MVSVVIMMLTSTYGIMMLTSIYGMKKGLDRHKQDNSHLWAINGNLHIQSQ